MSDPAPTNPPTPTPQPPGTEQTQATPQPLQTLDPKPPNKTVRILGIVFLIAAAIITAGAYFFYQNYQSNQQNILTYEDCAVASGSVIQESYPETCVTSDGLSFTHQLTPEEQSRLQTNTPGSAPNWQTYTNTKHSFSFDFPEKLTVTDEKEELDPYSYTLETVKLASFVDPKTIVKDTDKPVDGFTLYIIPDIGNITFQQFFENEKRAFDEGPRPSELTSDDAQDYEAGGQTGILLQTQSFNFDLYIPSPNSNAVIIFSLSLWTDEFEEEIQQILSTFEFTN